VVAEELEDDASEESSPASSAHRTFTPIGKPVVRGSGEYWATLDRKLPGGDRERLELSAEVKSSGQARAFFIYARRATSNGKWSAGIASLDGSEISVTEASFRTVSISAAALKMTDPLRARLFGAYSAALLADKSTAKSDKRVTRPRVTSAAKFSPAKAAAKVQSKPDPRTLQRKSANSVKVTGFSSLMHCFVSLLGWHFSIDRSRR